MTLKDQLQYRKLNKKADRQGDCLECKHQKFNFYDKPCCTEVDDLVQKGFTCNEWGRG
jgi:hypothetical protein